MRRMKEYKVVYRWRQDGYETTDEDNVYARSLLEAYNIVEEKCRERYATFDPIMIKEVGESGYDENSNYWDE